MNFDVLFCNSFSGKMIVAFLVSQLGVGTQLRCGEKQESFYCKYFSETKGERIFKIGKHLAKL